MMPNNKNKGFSLVEIIIAIAVMTLLISPIIAQTIQTLNTSARAKERQYVVDNADKIMEYFRSSSVNDLSKTGKKGDDKLEITSVTTYDGSSVTTLRPRCQVYYGDTNIGYVDYTATDYELSDAKLGKEKHNYTRTVTLDDLSNVLMDRNSKDKDGTALNNIDDGEAPDKYRYFIRYDINNSTSDIGDLSNWEITSEGSAVQYDDNHHVKAIVVDRMDYDEYRNPNEVPLGNIQDLDSTTMAIIEGSATDVDVQFRQDFIGSLMDIIARHKAELVANDTWDDYTDKENLNSVFEDVIQGTGNNFNRMIKITCVGEDIVDNKPSYYRVRVDVYLKAIYTFLGESIGSSAKDNEKYAYTVYNQKFYTEEPPDIFLVYEPFITQTGVDYVTYANNDHINIRSDKYTSGAIKGVDPTKIYLVKAEETWANTNSKIAGLPDNNYFLTQVGGKYVPVNINVTQTHTTGKPVEYDGSEEEELPLQIITNISMTGSSVSDYKINEPYDGQRQFSTNFISNNNLVPDRHLASTETYCSYPSQFTSNEMIDYPDGTSKPPITYPLNDKRTQSRLFSITVRYHNEDVESEKNVYTYFTGAKGAD
jgi:prepilin-type N-terminal cleavage/methylation domain-containing protein